MTFHVIRKAVLPEDEGRESSVALFSTQELAQQWIDRQAGEYFKPSDYYIAAQPELVDKLFHALDRLVGISYQINSCADPKCKICADNRAARAQANEAIELYMESKKHA